MQICGRKAVVLVRNEIAGKRKCRNIAPTRRRLKMSKAATGPGGQPIRCRMTGRTGSVGIDVPAFPLARTHFEQKLRLYGRKSALSWPIRYSNLRGTAKPPHSIGKCVCGHCLHYRAGHVIQALIGSNRLPQIVRLEVVPVASPSRHPCVPERTRSMAAHAVRGNDGQASCSSFGHDQCQPSYREGTQSTSAER